MLPAGYVLLFGYQEKESDIIPCQRVLSKSMKISFGSWKDALVVNALNYQASLSIDSSDTVDFVEEKFLNSLPELM